VTLTRLGGAAAGLGGIAWLALFMSGNGGTPIEWLEDAMWALPLAFGLGAIGLYAPATSTFDRTAILIAAVASVAAAAAVFGGSALALTGEIAYAAWLAFVGGIAVLLCLVLAYGIRRRADGGLALVALVATLLPIAFLAVIFGYKVLTGWWVTDPGLIAFGTVGAAVLVGGAWVALGVAMLLLQPAARLTEAAG
jgi:hypothetical protein